MFDGVTQVRGSHIVAGLERTYETVLGEKKRLENAEYGWEGANGYQEALEYWLKAGETLDNLLRAIETTIRLFEPKWDPTKLKPKIRHLTKRQVTDADGVAGGLFRVLRNMMAPLTVAELVIRVGEHLELPTGRPDQRSRLYRAIYAALKRYEEKNIVTCAGGRPARWFLNREDD